MRRGAIALASWPGLARPSTTGGAECGKVVDGRHKAGHDTVGTTVPPARYLNAYAGQAAGQSDKDNGLSVGESAPVNAAASIMWTINHAPCVDVRRLRLAGCRWRGRSCDGSNMER